MMQCDAGGGAIDEKACGAFVMRWRMEMIGNLASRVMLPRFFLIFLLTYQCTISNSNSGSAPSATLPYQHQQQWPSIILISTHRLSNGSKLFRNGLKLSPSLGWTIGHLWFILIEIEIDVQAHTYYFISLYCPVCQTFFSRMFSSDKPQGPSRFQSPGIQGKRVPRPGSRMARGPDQVKIKVKENSSHLDEVEVLLEKDKRLPFLQGKLGQH